MPGKQRPRKHWMMACKKNTAQVRIIWWNLDTDMSQIDDKWKSSIAVWIKSKDLG